jgi:hypothetical protein
VIVQVEQVRYAAPPERLPEPLFRVALHKRKKQPVMETSWPNPSRNLSRFPDLLLGAKLFGIIFGIFRDSSTPEIY